MSEGGRKKVEASSHEKAETVRSPLPDSWAYTQKKPLLKYLDERPPKHTEGITLKTKHEAWNDDAQPRNKFCGISNVKVAKLFVSSKRKENKRRK